MDTTRQAQIGNTSRRTRAGAPHRTEGAELTPREREVLEVLAGGLGLKHAAHELKISYETVRTHVRNIYRKLGARTLCSALNRYRV